MIFPIGDDNVKGKYFPVVSYTLIVLNILAFIYSISNGLNATIKEYGANPCLIKDGLEFSDLYTSMFLHGGIAHIIGNMLFLWIFADNIETEIGNLRFLLFYLAGGLVAAFVHIAIDARGGCIPMVGASGAISAVMGSYLVMFPKSRIKMLFLIKIFYIPAFVFLGFWIAEQLLSGFTSLRIFQPGEEKGGVAFWAHIGGFAFGVLAGLYFKRKYPKIDSTQNGNGVEYKTVMVEPRRYNNRF